MRIDFAWFLGIWLLHFHCDEKVFWKTMNPARCHALYGALFQSPKSQKTSAQSEPRSLLAYLKGGE